MPFLLRELFHLSSRLVDSSEFFVTLAETITFMGMIGPESFHWLWVVALIIGGSIAAPVAAYTSKRILVGLILMITNRVLKCGRS